jgi:hypothetical protein
MDKIESVLNWLGSRLSERSSWLGLTAILTSVGVTISPDMQNIIIQIGIALAGLVSFLTTDSTTVAVVPAATTTTTTATTTTATPAAAMVVAQ